MDVHSRCIDVNWPLLVHQFLHSLTHSPILSFMSCKLVVNASIAISSLDTDISNLVCIKIKRMIITVKNMKHQSGADASSVIIMKCDCSYTSRVYPFSVGDCPTVICLRYRSLVSITLFHVMVAGSMSSRANRRWSATFSLPGERSAMPSFSRRLI